MVISDIVCRFSGGPIYQFKTVCTFATSFTCFWDCVDIYWKGSMFIINSLLNKNCSFLALLFVWDVNCCNFSLLSKVLCQDIGHHKPNFLSGSIIEKKSPGHQTKPSFNANAAVQWKIIDFKFDSYRLYLRNHFLKVFIKKLPHFLFLGTEETNF